MSSLFEVGYSIISNSLKKIYRHISLHECCTLQRKKRKYISTFGLIIKPNSQTIENVCVLQRTRKRCGGEGRIAEKENLSLPYLSCSDSWVMCSFSLIKQSYSLLNISHTLYLLPFIFSVLLCCLI